MAEREPSPAPRVDDVDVDLWNAVYTAILTHCPLSDEDRTYLREQYGSDTADTDEAGEYGTLPAYSKRGALVAALEALGETYGHGRLLTVAGIVEKDGRLHLKGEPGLLIAVREYAGRIVALKLRLRNGSKRYITSRGKDHPDGPSPGTPVHVARPAVVRDSHIVWLTEGEKKANVAAYRQRAVVLGIPGITNGHEEARAILRRLRDEGALAVIIALDSDDPRKPTGLGEVPLVERVESIRRKLARMASGMGMAARNARWDHADGKGIDDLLAAGHTFTKLEVYEPAPDVPTGAALPHGPEGVTSATIPDGCKLAYMADVTLNRTLSANDVRAKLTEWFVADTWPRGPRADGSPHAGRLLPVTTMAQLMGCDRGTVQTAIENGKANGLTDFDKLYTTPHGPSLFRPTEDKETPKPTHFYPVAPWPLGLDKWYAPSDKRKKEAQKKHCPHCGSVHIVSKKTCDDCGQPVTKMTEQTVRREEQEKARASRTTSLAAETCGISPHTLKGGEVSRGEEDPSLSETWGEIPHVLPTKPPGIVAALVERLQAWRNLEHLDADWRAVCRDPSYRALVADDPDSAAVVTQAYWTHRNSLGMAEEVRYERAS